MQTCTVVSLFMLGKQFQEKQDQIFSQRVKHLQTLIKSGRVFCGDQRLERGMVGVPGKEVLRQVSLEVAQPGVGFP